MFLFKKYFLYLQLNLFKYSTQLKILVDNYCKIKINK